jgi:type I restriction enzyme R subunit
VIDDVPVRVAVERYQTPDGKLITEDYRVLLQDDIKQVLQAEFGSLPTSCAAGTARAQAGGAGGAGRPRRAAGNLQQAVPGGGKLDAFDLVAHVAFNQKPLTRRERASNVKKRDVFGKSANRPLSRSPARQVADRRADIEDAKVLELPP